jgi:hypothetical protein
MSARDKRQLMNDRELETMFSSMDKAIQHFAEYMVNGSPIVYERDDPVRGVLVACNRMTKRVEIIYERRQEKHGFLLVADAWQDLHGQRRYWVAPRIELESLPQEYDQQLDLLKKAWSCVENISEADLLDA